MKKNKFCFTIIIQLLVITMLWGAEGYNWKTEIRQQNGTKGKLLYQNELSNEKDIKGWKLEGPAKIEFEDSWMHMYSPNEEGHHVLWCPEDFPGSFIAEWELQNIETDAGLCIVFFAAKGAKGEDVFDSSLKKRNGVFSGYTKSDLNNYHISYYANGKDNRAREVAHLRKNAGFNKVQVGELGIPVHSAEVYKMKLVKDNNNIQMFANGRKIIDWVDDGKEYGPVLDGGKIGLRQMKWTHFRYRDFKVWELVNSKK